MDYILQRDGRIPEAVAAALIAVSDGTLRTVVVTGGAFQAVALPLRMAAGELHVGIRTNLDAGSAAVTLVSLDAESAVEFRALRHPFFNNSDQPANHSGFLDKAFPLPDLPCYRIHADGDFFASAVSDLTTDTDDYEIVVDHLYSADVVEYDACLLP